jgi:hypothetical protein
MRCGDSLGRNTQQTSSPLPPAAAGCTSTGVTVASEARVRSGLTRPSPAQGAALITTRAPRRHHVAKHRLARTKPQFNWGAALVRAVAGPGGRDRLRSRAYDITPTPARRVRDTNAPARGAGATLTSGFSEPQHPFPAAKPFGGAFGFSGAYAVSRPRAALPPTLLIAELAPTDPTVRNDVSPAGARRGVRSISDPVDQSTTTPP